MNFGSVPIVLLTLVGISGLTYLGKPALAPVLILTIFAGVSIRSSLTARRQLKAANQPLENPDPDQRVRAAAACAAAGRPDLPIRWVQGAGLAVIRLDGGELLLSPATVDMLPEPELAALVAASFAAPHFDQRRHLRAHYFRQGVFVAVLLLFFGSTYLPGLHLLSPLLLIGLFLSIRLGPGSDQQQAKLYHAVVDAGIDPLAYGAAISRIQHFTFKDAPRSLREKLLKAQERQLELLAQISGVSPSRLQAAVTAAGMPVSLDWSGQVTPWWRPYRYLLIVPAVFLLMLMIAVGIAVSLMNSLPAAN